MIATPNSPPAVMKKALGHTLAMLDAAVERDVDLAADKKAKLKEEYHALAPWFKKLSDAATAAETYELLDAMKLQARVIVGDRVLDRGVRTGKARTRIDLKNSTMPEGADYVFGKDVETLVDEEMVKEPGAVLEALARFKDVPDFASKADVKKDLETRATSQQKAFAERDGSHVTWTGLRSALVRLIADASDQLYRLEKRLLDQFPRERDYVRKFFLQVKTSRPGQEEAPPAAATP